MEAAAYVQSQHDSHLRRLDPVSVEDRLGEVGPQQVPDGIDVVHDQHQGRGDEGQGHGAHTGDERGEQGDAGGDGKDEELEPVGGKQG